MMQEILNQARREAQRVMAQRAMVRMGTVTSYDPDNYAAKVRIQPEGHETGWLPIHSPAAGSGNGFFFGPSPGDVVEVHYQEGGKGAPFIGLRQFGDRNRPVRVESGEFMAVHKDGGFVKLTGDGRLSMQDAQGASFTLNNDGSGTITTSDGVAIDTPVTVFTGIVDAVRFYAQGIPTVADGTYCTGLGLAQNGYITITGGLITAIQEAS